MLDTREVNELFGKEAAHEIIERLQELSEEELEELRASFGIIMNSIRYNTERAS
ncbi:hypothetical protein [Paenibacillus thermotolerans]|uniref:hypothetical protein n=1 Tax=Paenibacillus thermotolerans TaxID=3027807 RepID=UPI002367D9EF|nr:MULTISPECIES: hypothetical protein [unclassified Paenibacillus]